MSRDVSDFAGEFVSGSGTAAYRDAITLASGLVANALEAADAPGLVDGYSLLKELADKPRLDTVAGVGLPAALEEAVGLMAGHSAVVTHPAYLAHLHCPPTVASLSARFSSARSISPSISLTKLPQPRPSSNELSNISVPESDTGQMRTVPSPVAAPNPICTRC